MLPLVGDRHVHPRRMNARDLHGPAA
jgi:hypothetical protein